MSINRISDNILDALGNTPLIRLNRMTGADSAEILVKYEGLAVGGSVKTRTAYNMILRAEQEGKLGPDSITVHSMAIKRAAGMAEYLKEHSDIRSINTPDMLSCAEEGARALDMLPY